GVEAVEFAILCADNGIAGTNLRGVRVRVVQVRENGLLIGHGDAEAVDGNLAHAGQQIFQSLGMQSQVDGVDVFAAECRIHDGGRERVGDGISGDAVDAGSGIDLLDAVEAAEILRRDLSGSS